MKTKAMKTVMPKLLSLILLFFVVACSSDDDGDGEDNPDVINEQETITTVRLTVTEEGSTEDPDEYTWLDGDESVAITLSADSSYNFKLEFLDESDPAEVEDITEEVIELADEHYVFFETADLMGTSFTSASDDTIDSDDIGINLSTDWTTTDASTGLIRAYLIHEPTTKSGSVRDDFGGDTDVQVDFDVTIE